MNRLLCVCLLLVLFVSHSVLRAQTFTFTVQDSTISYENGFNTYSFRGSVTNLLSVDRQLVFTLTPVTFPDPLRMYSICTYHGCYPPDSGFVVINESYTASQQDDSLIFDIYNLAINPESGFADTSTIHGNYVLRASIHNPDNVNEITAYNLYLDQITGITTRIEPVVLSSALISNYPNPFNPETTINFVVSNPGAVEMNVYNLLGQNVSTLINAPFMSSGNYSATWNATSASGLPLPSGIYLVELNNSGLRAVHRIVLQK